MPIIQKTKHKNKTKPYSNDCYWLYAYVQPIVKCIWLNTVPEGVNLGKFYNDIDNMAHSFPDMHCIISIP